MDVSDPDIAAQFNAISIGFTTPQIIEGFTGFNAGFENYDQW